MGNFPNLWDLAINKSYLLIFLPIIFVTLFTVIKVEATSLWPFRLSLHNFLKGRRDETEISSRFAFVYNYRYTDSSQSVYPKTTWYSWLEKGGLKRALSGKSSVFISTLLLWYFFSPPDKTLTLLYINHLPGEVSPPTVRTWLQVKSCRFELNSSGHFWRYETK